VRERIEYRFTVPSAAVFTLYSYSKALEYRFRVPTAGSLKYLLLVLALYTWARSLELSVAYFQPASSVFLSHKSANSTFSRLFSAQANKLQKFSRPVKIIHVYISFSIISLLKNNKFYDLHSDSLNSVYCAYKVQTSCLSLNATVARREFWRWFPSCESLMNPW
jgi:hypothetical protein